MRALSRPMQHKSPMLRDAIRRSHGKHSLWCLYDVTPFGCVVCHDAAVAEHDAATRSDY